jgi:hypothetical protein
MIYSLTQMDRSGMIHNKNNNQNDDNKDMKQ